MGRSKAGSADGVGAVSEVAAPPTEIRATYVDAGPRLLLRWGDAAGKRYELMLGKGDRATLSDRVVLVFD